MQVSHTHVVQDVREVLALRGTPEILLEIVDGPLPLLRLQARDRPAAVAVRMVRRLLDCRGQLGLTLLVPAHVAEDLAAQPAHLALFAVAHVEAADVLQGRRELLEGCQRQGPLAQYLWVVRRPG
jgi:hypothetical protein